LQKVSLALLEADSSPRLLKTRKQKRKYDTNELTVGLWHSVGILPDILGDESEEAKPLSARRAFLSCFFSFALDLKSEFKRI
jgi:hypothetical protein